MAPILIVDDHLGTCEMLVRLIKRFHGDAACVDRGQAALDFIRKQPPALMFLDMMMPGMTGLEVLRTLRADRKLSAMPVVMFSAYLDPDVIRQALEAGAQEYLIKEDIAGILKAVAKYLTAVGS